MLDQDVRIRNRVKTILKELSLGEQVGFSVGAGFSTVPMPNGNVYVGPLWCVTVSMNNPLVGYGDIVMSAPVPGALPKDEVFEKVVAKLLEECRQERSKVLRGESA